MANALFIGKYPHPINPYRNVFFQNLIFEIADKGYDCTVISPVSVCQYKTRIGEIPKKTIHETPRGNKVTVYYPRFVSTSSKKIGNFSTAKISEYFYIRSAVGLAKKLNIDFDFSYGHFFIHGGLAAIKAGNALGIPSFVAYGESSYEDVIKNRFGDILPGHIKGLSGIIAVSGKNAEELKNEKIYDNIPMIIAPNATDKSKFYVKDKAESRKELGISEDKFVVGFVGGFNNRKGDKRVLEAIEGLNDVYGAFAGRGSNPPSGEKVVFCKSLEHRDVCTFLNAIDIFCLPTLNEGSCNAVVEAMSCGKAIVSSDLSFNYDALNSDNSVLVNPNSVEEIRNAIKNLREDEALRKRISEKALEDSEEFTIGKRVENILNFIKANSNKKGIDKIGTNEN